MVQKYLFYEKSMGSRVGGREFRYTPYQAYKMELFAETANGYFRKKLHLMFEICLKGFWICVTWKRKQPFKQKGKWFTQKLLRTRLRWRFLLVKVLKGSENSKDHLHIKWAIFSIGQTFFQKKNACGQFFLILGIL